MKTRIILTAGFIFGVFAFAQASPLTPEAALERALSEKIVPTQVKAKAKSGYKLSKTVSSEAADALYVFDTSDSFIVVGADDSLPPVLGYGDGASGFSEGSQAPGFEYWLGELARQAAYNSLHGGKSRMRTPQEDFEPISPLLTTTWSQADPYNQKCPPKKSEIKAVTGCVATAMAQVMKYHNWPPVGEGKITYKSQYYGELRVNFANTPLDWENMLDAYEDGDWTQEQADAVATLMMCAGYSVQMNYSPLASGAMAMIIAPALGTYFRYDKRLSYDMRDYYRSEAWEKKIYESLRDFGPVVYDGQAKAGGHSFVCDGYAGDGYFHFNWGWGGMSDGYFLLDCLDPEHQGIGGADGGFDWDQDAVTGIRPDRSGNDIPFTSKMVSPGPFVLQYDEADYPILYIRNMMYNIGPGAIEEGAIGLSFTKEGEDPIYWLATFSGLGVMYGYSDLGFEAPELDDGTYLVETIFAIGNYEVDDPETVYKVMYMPGQTDGWYITYEGGRVTSLTEAPAGANVSDVAAAPEPGNDAIFTIDGRRVNSMVEPGFYIRGGKKILKR